MKEYKPKTLDISTQDYWKDYQYWQVQEKLKIWREVAGSTWWNIKLWSFTITTTWSIAITWLWFKPSYVKFLYYASTWRWEWEMSSTQMRAYDPKTLTTITSDVIYIRDWASSVIARAQYVSMDSDWFTINCSFTTANLVVYYTAM